MSFLPTDLDRIRRFLGYPVIGSTQFIQDRMDAIAGESPDAVARIQEYLRELEKVNDQINKARPYAAQSFVSGAATTAQFYRGDRMAILREEGRRYVQELSNALGLAIAQDIFKSPSSTSQIRRS
ncbi:MAG TPA: hypothetical protein V6C63_02035 [Allocoleopsis sp.]